MDSDTIRFPKRIRSASAKLFSTNNNSVHQHTTSNKRISCQIFTSSDQKILSPSTWFPRIRCRSTSSASSTFSMVFSSTASNTVFHEEHQDENYQTSDASLLESLSSELQDLYQNAKEEIDYAFESQGSIYYEGDKSTAQQAVHSCNLKYNEAMQLFGDSALAIKFKFRWETDLYQLIYRLNSLPLVTHSIYA